eukprot:351280-Chlamydomonas_euryale.AAC.12
MRGCGTSLPLSAAAVALTLRSRPCVAAAAAASMLESSRHTSGPMDCWMTRRQPGASSRRWRGSGATVAVSWNTAFRGDEFRGVEGRCEGVKGRGVLSGKGGGRGGGVEGQGWCQGSGSGRGGVRVVEGEEGGEASVTTIAIT